MTRARLVLLETSDLGAPYLADAARLMGLEPLFLCELDAYQADTRRALVAEPHVDTPTDDVAALVELVRARGEPIYGVATLADHRLVTALELAEALSAGGAHEGPGSGPARASRGAVRGLDPAVRLLKDKAKVAALVPEHSPPSLSLHRDTVRAADLTPLFERTGSLVLKPARGAGGVGLCVVSPHEVDRALRHVAEATLPRSFGDGEWLAQAALDGPVVSAEGYVAAGRLSVLGFSDRRRVGVTESGSRFPVDATLDPSQRAEARLALERLFARAGLERGWFHVELVLSQGRVWLIDANVGRIGGGPVGDLVSVAFELPPAVVYRHVLEVALTGAPTLDPFAGRAPRPAFAAVYGMARGGRMGGVTAGALSSHHVLLVDPGSTVPAMGADDRAWVGMLTGHDGVVQREMEGLLVVGPDGPEAPVW